MANKHTITVPEGAANLAHLLSACSTFATSARGVALGGVNVILANRPPNNVLTFYLGTSTNIYAASTAALCVYYAYRALGGAIGRVR